jgi:hypothetical protein
MIVLTGQIPFIGIIVFFSLYFLVVRNPRIHYFIRFNTMQALLIETLVFIYGLLRWLVDFLPLISQFSIARIALQVFDNLVFLSTVAVVGYAIFQCIRGIYPELQVITNASKPHLDMG